MLAHKYTLNLLKTGYHILILITLTTTAIALGGTPEINWQNKTVNINNQAVAQDPSDDDLRKYAQAAVEIENLRKTTFTNIENIVGKSKPNQLNCNRQESLNQLPDNARSIAVSYCKQSEAIVKKYGLSINQFNQITQQVRQNPEIKRKLQSIVGQM